MRRTLFTYPDSVRFLYALGNESKTAKLGLAKITVLLERLGDPHRAARFVHVAGTNGKGSVSAMIESALRASGRRTGLFTSPHLVEPTERIGVAGHSVSPELFADAFDRVHREAERLMAQGALENHPTYFETVAAMAFLLFRELGAEMVVLEVGLGGRLDATNVVHPEVTVITPIDYDHEAFLGKSLEAIAGEKAGIIKPGVPLVLGPQKPAVDALLTDRATELGAPMARFSDWSVQGLNLHSQGSQFVAEGPRRVSVDCPLAGEHQISNALTAIATLHVLGTPTPAIEEGLRQVRWPGRLERVSREPEIVLDGAHNPAGAMALSRYIQSFYADRRVWLVYGAMRDKAVSEVAGILFPSAHEVILTAPNHPRAVRPELVRNLVDHPCVQVAANLGESLKVISAASPEDAIFITGSLFLVGEARALLVK